MQGIGHIKDTFGEAPIIHAVRKENLELLKYVIEQGANVNTQDANGRNALYYAARQGNVAIAKKLVKAGANPSIAEKSSRYPPVVIAALNGHREVVSFLKTVDKETPRMDIISGLLHFYARRGKTTLVTRILGSNQEYDIDFKDEKGWTPLVAAASSGHDKVAQELINAGAKVDSRTSLRTTALHHAARGGHLNVTELLLASDADPNAQDQLGKTPLMYTDNVTVAETLWNSEKHDASIIDGEGRTAKEYFDELKVKD